MPETCENCKKPMEDWSATHCSEECLLNSIKKSVSFHNGSGTADLIAKTRKNNRFDIRQLEDLK